VRTRWFFNASCEGCLERDAATGERPGDSRGVSEAEGHGSQQ
jgi:hypothetical protein